MVEEATDYPTMRGSFYAVSVLHDQRRIYQERDWWDTELRWWKVGQVGRAAAEGQGGLQVELEGLWGERMG